MSFLNARPDLTGKIFAHEHLLEAQSQLGAYLRDRHPDWLKAPRGILASRWDAKTIYDACYFIELVRILIRLSSRFDERSRGVLLKKFDELLEASDETAFEAILSELQYADHLAGHDLSFEYEPPVTKKTGETGRPEFAIQTGDGIQVFVDVTRFRYRILDEWEQARNQWSGLLTDRLGFEAAGRVVTITLPLEARSERLKDNLANWIVSEVKADKSGEVKCPGLSSKVVVRWYTPKIVPKPRTDEARINFAPDATRKPVISLSSGIGAVVATEFPEIQATELLVKAIRNRLDDKRKQFTAEEPYIICMRTGHFQQFTSTVIQIAAQRLWPNSQYRRIAGLVIFFPRMVFEANPGPGTQPYAIVDLNPKAAYPMPESLKRAMGLVV